MVAHHRQRSSWTARSPRWGWLVAFAIGLPALAHPQELETQAVAKLYRAGLYAECESKAAEAIADGGRDEDWFLLKIRAEMAQGKYGEALKSLDAASRQHPNSVEIFLVGLDVRRMNNAAGKEKDELALMERRVLGSPRREFATAARMVALGRFSLLRLADPKKVLDQFYGAVLKQQPEYVEAHLAAAELALSKQDFGLAAETLQKAPKAAAEDPRFHFLLAMAFAESDRVKAAASIEDALKINPRHADSLLLKVDALIDSERYAEAGTVLDQVAAVNPSEPRAWAFRAALAQLKNDEKGEAEARSKALTPWPKNPEVDSIIGRKLAQKYRFAEGAAYQRRALEMDPTYLPAKVELSEALLRLGEEEEGWTLVDEIFAADGYNVVAFNLMALRDRLAKFRRLEADGLVVKMDPREADLYGARVLDLLKRAKAVLSERYGATLPSPVIVEIFPDKKEFAVRTFGLPGADGLLGVCFGKVITANSPASQGEHPSNWEAVLWHELCHAVTLTKTRNKMPRWLSEGISVYEEGQQNHAWRGALTPEFREMVLGPDFTPLSKLSGAFLTPKSAMHVQFAYIESAMAVEFLVETAGLPALRGVLDDLGAGKGINDSLPARTGMSLTSVDAAFAKFARAKAEAIAPGATWEDPELPDDADSKAVAEWLKAHPKSFRGKLLLATRLVREKKWPEAKAALIELKSLYAGYVGEDNPYMLLAAVSKATSDPAAEAAILEEWAERDGDATPAFTRLIELREAAKDWDGVLRNARRMLAVNPLIPAPHRSLARCSVQLGRRDEAIAAYRALSILDETDPAETHFQLARLLSQAGQKSEARREVLKSLEEAPRFLDAHALLLELVGPEASQPRR